ncbi:MAG TPA: hypothetical protein VGM02_17765 [Acidobacteriaceae bacterium]|jgi:hypothetical protein
MTAKGRPSKLIAMPSFDGCSLYVQFGGTIERVREHFGRTLRLLSGYGIS